jgi:Domain of unknown function (DUF1851)
MIGRAQYCRRADIFCCHRARRVHRYDNGRSRKAITGADRCDAAFDNSLEGINRTRLLRNLRVAARWVSSIAGVTRMGDAFVERADGEVIFLDTLEGTLKHAATNQNAFLKLLKAERSTRRGYILIWHSRLEARSERLAPGQCYSYKIPPILGGSFESANVKAVSALVHFCIMGQLHEQTRHLPPGTKISHFTIVEYDTKVNSVPP